MICKTFDELTKKELYELLRARQEVFIIEQDCNYLDLDRTDYSAYHIYELDESDSICCYARIYEDEAESHIGRVLTPSTLRRKGHGIRLMQEAITQCKAIYGTKDIVISAQEYLLAFYGGFGFVVEGGRYFEDNLPHFKMRLQF
ncbi:MAG: GNAT family N-acetyltransferase [Flavobacteriaceae bacterium]